MGLWVLIIAAWYNCVPLANETRARSLTTIESELHSYFQWTSPPFSMKQFFGQISQARLIITKHDIDVVHSNNAAPCQWLVPACFLVGRPLVVLLHAIYLRRSRVVLGAHFANKVIGVSRATVQPYLNDGLTPADVEIIPNTIDAEVLSNRASEVSMGLPELSDNTLTVVAIGALIPSKGMDILIDAAGRLGDLRDKFQILIVGDGVEQTELKAQAIRASVAAIHFLGWRRDVPALLSQFADILVLPSRQESFGLVLLEAACFGLPVLATDVGGVSEAMVDGETGLLVAAEDPDALAKGLRRLITDRALRRRLGSNGKSRVETEFQPKQAAARYEKIYESLSNGGFLRPGKFLSPLWSCLRSRKP